MPAEGSIDSPRHCGRPMNFLGRNARSTAKGATTTDTWLCARCPTVVTISHHEAVQRHGKGPT